MTGGSEEPTEAPTETPTETPTEEPTDAPIVDDQFRPVTFSVVAPKGNSTKATWNDAVFFYGNTSTFADLTKVAMTKTDEKYYTGDTFNSEAIKGGAWDIFTVTLTAAQAEEAYNSRIVGFASSNGSNRTQLLNTYSVLRAGTDSYTEYASANAHPNNFDGKTFLFAEAGYDSKSLSSYRGYWLTDYVTVKAAAPMANTDYSNWNGVQLYYGDGKVVDDMPRLDMIKTSETTKVTIDNPTLRSGRWYIYALTVPSTLADTISASGSVGIIKKDASNRTYRPMNILKAKTNVFDGEYNTTARTLAELEGQVFVVSGQATTSAVQAYTGMWETEELYTQGRDDEITIYFAAPIGVAGTSCGWNTGVELYYGNESNYADNARIELTATGDTYYVDVTKTNVTDLFVSGNWAVYSATLTVQQIRAIDDSAYVGFVKSGSFDRTYHTNGKSIVRASKMDGVTSYGAAQSIEMFDGHIFMINSTNTATKSAERTSFLGSWSIYE